MEFKEKESDAERELKLRVLHIYRKRYLYSHMNVHVLGIRCNDMDEAYGQASQAYYSTLYFLNITVGLHTF